VKIKYISDVLHGLERVRPDLADARRPSLSSAEEAPDAVLQLCCLRAPEPPRRVPVPAHPRDLRTEEPNRGAHNKQAPRSSIRDLRITYETASGPNRPGDLTPHKATHVAASPRM
jgi:hypothetical protein